MDQAQESNTQQSGLRPRHLLGAVLATLVVTALLTWWALSTFLYAKDFQPVVLDDNEQQQLTSKLVRLGYQPDRQDERAQQAKEDAQWLKPEPYSEVGGKREIQFSERELNSLIANDRQLARKLAVDLSDDLVSVRLLVPLDPDFPLLGGKTLRLAAGVEMAYRTNRPSVTLKGVSLMGVPMPSAWLGGLKNVDLISEFGDQQGFWAHFAQGVEDIQVVDGSLRIRLRE